VTLWFHIGFRYHEALDIGRLAAYNQFLTGMTTVDKRGKEPPVQDDFQPRIVAFLCNWCSYAGADLAGISRIQYPATIRVIRVPCSGRVDPFFILKALQDGADGVLVSGCHPGDCHYLTGNYVARRRFAVLSDLLTFFGIKPGRVMFSWVSAAEGERFAEVVRKATEQVRGLGPSNRLAASRRLEEALNAER
jgi:coenzyme F420-reducing hydrogenase delta subunit